MDLNLDVATLRTAFLYLLIGIISFTVHEWGHAAMADRLGDGTPRSQGRVTLNPLVHIDLIGTIIIPLLCALGFLGNLGMIGWAKPVMTNPAAFRNRTRDQAWVTIAGPGMNLVLATVATLAWALSFHFLPKLAPLFEMIVGINAMLIAFNLLPIPPLDGSKFLMYWFGMSEETYGRLSQFSGFALLILVNIPAFRELLYYLYKLAFMPFAALFYLLT